jgi:hypothetical protein
MTLSTGPNAKAETESPSSQGSKSKRRSQIKADFSFLIPFQGHRFCDLPGGIIFGECLLQ